MKSLNDNTYPQGGVYKISNTQNQRVYIGSTLNFAKRWKEHLRNLKQNKHCNRFLQADYNICGKNAFSFQILENVDGDKLARTISEQKYLDEFFDKGKQCYNLKKDAIGYQGIRKACFEETKKKIGDANRGRIYSPESLENIRKAAKRREGKKHKRISGNEWKQKNPEVYEKMVRLGKLMAQKNFEKTRNATKGKPLSDEVRRKLSEAHKGHKHSEETKKKMSDSQKNRKHKINKKEN